MTSRLPPDSPEPRRPTTSSGGLPELPPALAALLAKGLPLPGGLPTSGAGPGVFGHENGRLDILEGEDRYCVFARLPETELDGVRVDFEDGELTIVARRDPGDRPLGFGVRLAFGERVTGELRWVLEGELLLVELSKDAADAPASPPDEDSHDDEPPAVG